MTLRDLLRRGPQHPQRVTGQPQNRLISNTDNLEDDWPAAVVGWTHSAACSAAPLPDRHKSHCQRGMSGPGCVPLGHVCVCLRKSEAKEWLMQMRSRVEVQLTPSRSDGFCQVRDIKEPVGFRWQLQIIQPAHYAFNIAHTQPCASILWHFYKPGLLACHTLVIMTLISKALLRPAHATMSQNSYF